MSHARHMYDINNFRIPVRNVGNMLPNARDVSTTATATEPAALELGYIQGDTAHWFKPPVDIKTEVLFWPGLP